MARVASLDQLQSCKHTLVNVAAWPGTRRRTQPSANSKTCNPQASQPSIAQEGDCLPLDMHLHALYNRLAARGDIAAVSRSVHLFAFRRLHMKVLRLGL